jgi:hypothetical protein
LITQNGRRTYGYSSKFKGSYEKVNPSFRNKFCARKKQFVRCTWMKNRIHTRYYFATRYPEKYKLADLKPLISFGASPTWKYWLMLQNVTLLSNDVGM